MLVLLFLLPILTSAQDSQRNDSQPSALTRGKWISEIMPQALSTFYPWSSKNEECTSQGRLYWRHLSNLTLWAVQMLDSSALSESGILTGSDYSFGNFDQCMRVQVPQLHLRGKYCLANLKFAPRYFFDNDTEAGFYTTPGPFSSVWNKIKRVNERRIKYRDNFYWAICIPSACDHMDLEESLRITLGPIFDKNNITINVTVDQFDCVKEYTPSKMSSGTVAYLITIGGFVVVALIATCIHFFLYRNGEKADEDNMILKFSLIKNGTELFEPENKTQYQFLSGMKVLSMACIIYGHRMLMTYAMPILNVEDVEERSTKLIDSVNTGGTVIVNTFLHVTGFLMFSKLLEDIAKNRAINVPVYIFYRWARTTPVYVAIIGLFIYIKPLTIEPTWGQIGLPRAESCKKNFWNHVLYINNYVDSSNECLLPSWYLAVDMQLFIVCVITGYIMSKFKRVGYFLVGILLTVSLIIPAFVTYYKGYSPILIMYINFMRNYMKESDYVDAYIPTHMRASPYFFGMVTAILVIKLKKNDFHFNWWRRIIIIIITGTLLLGTLLSTWMFFKPDRIVSITEKTLYPIFQRTAWAIAISCVIFYSLFNENAMVKKILSSSIFIPLNKLTLGALLIHPLVIGYLLLVQRRSSYVDTSVLVAMSAGDFIVSYLLSLVFYLFIEAPLSRILSYVVKKISGIGK